MVLQEYLDKRYTKEELKVLKVLNCSSKGLTSLQGIENLTNLEILDCSNNKINTIQGTKPKKKKYML